MDFPVFKTPCTICIAGCSQSGKTSLLKKILENQDCVFDKTFENVYLFYRAFQPLYENLPNVILESELPNFEYLKQINGPALVIFDDLQGFLSKSDQFLEFITTHVHHNQITVLLLLQNIFLKGLRSVRINGAGYFLLKNPGDKLSIETLGRQLYPKNSKFFMKAYNDATKNPYSYLLVDLSAQCNEKLRLRGCILRPEWPVTVYKQ